MSLIARFIMLLLSASIVIVKPDQVAVVHQWIGSASSSVWPIPLGQGIHFIVPFLDEPILYSTGPQAYTIDQPNSIMVHTADSHVLKVDISVIYQIDPGQVNMLYEKWGTHLQENFIDPAIRKAVQNVFTPYTEEQFYQRTFQENGITMFADDIRLAIAYQFRGGGLYMNDAAIRNVRFTDAFIAKIEATQIVEATATALAKSK